MKIGDDVDASKTSFEKGYTFVESKAGEDGFISDFYTDDSGSLIVKSDMQTKEITSITYTAGQNAASGTTAAQNATISDEARISKCSNYSYAMGTRRYNSSNYSDTCRWTLRYSEGVGLKTIFENGWANARREWLATYEQNIRPVINLNSTSINLYSYAGTVGSDRTVNEVEKREDGNKAEATTEETTEATTATTEVTTEATTEKTEATTQATEATTAYKPMESENVEEVPEGYKGIYNIADLNGIRNNTSGNYILMNDIDLTEATSKGGSWDTGHGWTPITSFTGTLDGNGYRIVGMNIYGTNWSSDSSIGFFGNLKGTVKNLGMKDVTIDVNTGNHIRGHVGRL